MRSIARARRTRKKENCIMYRERIAFLDWLRVAACFMVMAIHSAEPFYLGGEAPDVTFLASRGDALWITVVECICRTCVPLFAIASSYLLFPVRRPAGEFFRRRFLRVGVPFLAWAAAYVWMAGGSWGKMCFNFPDEGGHLWFVPMIAGLYILMPLLSPWAEKVGKKELFLWICAWLFTTLFPFARLLWTRLYGAPSFGAVPYLWGECPWNGFGAFHYISGFAGYMMIGLWFRKFGRDLSWARTLSVAVPLWLAGAAIMGTAFFGALSRHGFPLSKDYAYAVVSETGIEYNSTGVALATIGAFMVLRKFEFKGAFYRFAVKPVSEASYGMYLMHMFFLAPFSEAFKPAMSTPLCIAATAACSFAASAAVAVAARKIPLAGKWICG